MKKLLVLLVLAFASCTPDDAPTVDTCGKVTARGWSCCGVGYNLTVNGEKILVSEAVYNKYQTGDTYCK
jgi:hypothetical protein